MNEIVSYRDPAGKLAPAPPAHLTPLERATEALYALLRKEQHDDGRGALDLNDFSEVDLTEYISARAEAYAHRYGRVRLRWQSFWSIWPGRDIRAFEVKVALYAAARRHSERTRAAQEALKLLRKKRNF